MSKPNGYIIHESATYVAIATGFRNKSKNTKTGAMIQIWIIPSQMHPVEALLSGKDEDVCLNCELRGRLGKARGCYVKMDHGPIAVWKKYRRGGYSVMAPEQYGEMFRGRFVRFGAYGEPVLLPFKTVKAIAEACDGWTGYTHQWKHPWLASYKRFFMASCSAADASEAIEQGWRAFIVTDKPMAGIMTCPASHEFEQARGYKLTCVDCGQCAGLSRKGQSVQIKAHGQGARYVRSPIMVDFAKRAKRYDEIHNP